jgi:hypothetical protein
MRFSFNQLQGDKTPRADGVKEKYVAAEAKQETACATTVGCNIHARALSGGDGCISETHGCGEVHAYNRPQSARAFQFVAVFSLSHILPSTG